MKINLENYLDIVTLKDALENEMKKELKRNNPNNLAYKSLLKTYNQLMDKSVLTNRRYNENGKIEGVK